MFRKLCSRKTNCWLLTIMTFYLVLYLYVKNSDEKQRSDKIELPGNTPRNINNALPQLGKNQNTMSLGNQTVTQNVLQDMMHVHNYSHPDGQVVKITNDQVVTYGHQRSSTGFLTLGIPTVKRKPGCEYLLRTLDALIQATSEADKERVVIVVFLADIDQQYNQVVSEVLVNNFGEHFKSGFMRTMIPPPDYYPDMSHLKRNFKDDESRVRWRSKQVLDYAFMFHQCANLSRYYMQLEDDVLPVSDYLSKIETFIRISSQVHWVELDFSKIGYIGKLYKQENMVKLAQFMMMFYDEQPVDWLNSYFRMTLAQKKPIIHKQALFSHIGLESTYDKNKKRKVSPWASTNHLMSNFNNCLSAHEYKASQSSEKGGVKLFSSMKAFNAKYGPESCYNSSGTYFWAVEPKANDTLSLIYDEPHNVRSLFVKTGSSRNPKDMLHEGIVSAATATDGKVTVDCGKLVKICDIVDGKCSYQGEVLKNIRCITVKVNKTQKDWIIFSQIRVIFE